MQSPFRKKQHDLPVTAEKVFSTVNTTMCCQKNPVAMYSSVMGDGFVVCATCELVLLRVAPRRVLDEVIPFVRQSLLRPSPRDPWGGNPDTDKYWRNP